jgi:hypothetical protein
MCGVLLPRQLPPILSRCISAGLAAQFLCPRMQEHDPLAVTENALHESKAKAELYARAEAARCMGAKVLVTLQQLEALNRQANSSTGNQTNVMVRCENDAPPRQHRVVDGPAEKPKRFRVDGR